MIDRHPGALDKLPMDTLIEIMGLLLRQVCDLSAMFAILIRRPKGM
jgi:hypothetical protein